MLAIKIHTTPDGRTLACVCDKAILGTVVTEGRKQLDLTGPFYAGAEEKSVVEIGDLIRNADLVHLTGKHAVQLGIDEELIDPDRIIIVDNVPHAQAVIDQE